jgi:hypothetical protein
MPFPYSALPQARPSIANGWLDMKLLKILLYSPVLIVCIVLFENNSVFSQIYNPNSGSSQTITVANSGNAVTNTGISTSEVNLVSIPLPALGPNDKLEIDTLWGQGGTSTNTHNIVVRLSTTSCAPLATCNSGGSLLNTNLNSSSLITAHVITSVWNANSTSSQSFFNSASNVGNGPSSAAISTINIQTNSTPFININCTTASSTSDSCTIYGYSIKRVSPTS